MSPQRHPVTDTSSCFRQSCVRARITHLCRDIGRTHEGPIYPEVNGPPFH